MKNIKNKIIISVMSILLLTGGLFAVAENSNVIPLINKSDAAKEVKLDKTVANSVQATIAPIKVTPSENYICATPLEIVANPDKYLNKKVKFKASFDKFSTLGLDYKPAMRDSQKYI